MKLLILSGFVIGLALAAGAVFLIGRSDDPVESQQAATRGRWYNVTYPTSVAANGGAFLVYAKAPLDRERPQFVVLNVDYPGAAAGLEVDGASGVVLRRGASDQADAMVSALLDALEAGLKLEPFDVQNATWPYGPGSGSEPDPLSGIIESEWLSQGRSGTLYENFRSRLIIWDSPEGVVEYTCSRMDPADKDAFGRLLLANAGPGVTLTGVDYPPGVGSCALAGP
jgi:hypothetical protein